MPPRQICEALCLYEERNEEEFAKFLQTFVQDVWNLLFKISQNPGQVRERRRGGGGSPSRALLPGFRPADDWRRLLPAPARTPLCPGHHT